MIVRPRWWPRAACRGKGPHDWFAVAPIANKTGRPRRDGYPNSAALPTLEARQRAQAVCDECVVRIDCLEHAITTHEDHGMWGGRTETERETIHHLLTAGHTLDEADTLIIEARRPARTVGARTPRATFVAASPSSTSHAQNARAVLRCAARDAGPPRPSTHRCRSSRVSCVTSRVGCCRVSVASRSR